MKGKVTPVTGMSLVVTMRLRKVWPAKSATTPTARSLPKGSRVPAAISMPGVVTEDKGTGIALHYRLAPELRDSLLITLEALIPKYPGQFTICEGRKVIEILPIGFSKGRALRKLASLPDFADRIPVMIGDDIADIDAFRAAEELGGYGLKVAGENFSEEEASFIGPADVLKWLENARTLTGSGKND